MEKNADIRVKWIKDGSWHQVPLGTTGMELAHLLVPEISKEVLAVEADGQVWDATRPLKEGQEVRFLTWEDKGGKHAFWHSSAHLLAQALERLYPCLLYTSPSPRDA